jgi:uncharacterized protein (TIGR03083 family)
MIATQNIPVDAVHLLPVLDRMLIDLLRSLGPEDWSKQTIAKLWTVKDVAAHLLDGNIRILSMLRDKYTGEPADFHTYEDLVQFLNRLNADWVNAMKRVSPEMLILLHETTGHVFCDYYKSLNPFEPAGLAVDWVGESESKNWMHIAREYSEKWLHQQQIRDAINKPGLMTRELFYPFIDTFMLALPHAYRDEQAGHGTVVELTVTTELGGSWFLERVDQRWKLKKQLSKIPITKIIIDPDTAWKLFSKSMRPGQVSDLVVISGDHRLAAAALSMVSVIA